MLIQQRRKHLIDDFQTFRLFLHRPERIGEEGGGQDVYKRQAYFGIRRLTVSRFMYSNAGATSTSLFTARKEARNAAITPPIEKPSSVTSYPFSRYAVTRCV